MDRAVTENLDQICFLFFITLSSVALEEEEVEEESEAMSQDTADTLPEEEEDTSERDALLGSSGTPDVEDSFL